jgi:hypothetical protein
MELSQNIPTPVIQVLLSTLEWNQKHTERSDLRETGSIYIGSGFNVEYRNNAFHYGNPLRVGLSLPPGINYNYTLTLYFNERPSHTLAITIQFGL